MISIQSEFDGLSVKVTGSLTPVIDGTSAQNQFGMFPDLRQKLGEHLPKSIDLSRVLAELKVFEGVWHYGYPGLHAYCLSNPVFNHKGDVIFELRPQGHGAQTAHRHAGGNTSASAGTISRQSSRAALSSRPSCKRAIPPTPLFVLLMHRLVLQKVKSAVTTAVQGERSSTASLNGSANGSVQSNGNGHSISASYTATKEMKYETVKREVVEESASQASFQVSGTSVA